MEQIFKRIRRPSGFESVPCIKALLEETWKVFPLIRNFFSLLQVGADGSLGFIVRKKGDTREPKRLIEIHMDEVTIHCKKHLSSQSKQNGVPMWLGTSNGNLKYHLWGESLDLYCVTSRTQRHLGKGYVMQKPPHFDSVTYKDMKEDSVMIRMESQATHRKVKQCKQRGYSIVAMFDSKITCNDEFCIGSGIDNAVSWYVLCKALDRFATTKTSFHPFLLQLSAKEEIGDTQSVFPMSKLRDMEVVCMDTELSEIDTVCVDKGIVIDSNIQWWNSQKHTQRLQDQKGGTNLDLFRSLKRRVHFGIPITGMHSASEQVSKQIIRHAIHLIHTYLKLKL